MKMLPEIIGAIVKSRPLTFLFAAFLIGCLIGWWLFGYVIWPVQYVGESYPYELAPAEKEEYLTMVASAYEVDKDLAQAKARLNKLGSPEEVNALMDGLIKAYREAGLNELAGRLGKLRQDVGAAPVVVASPSPGGTPPVAALTPTPPAPPPGSLIGAIWPICAGLVGVILVIALAGLAVSLARRRREAALARGEPRPAAPYWEAGQPPLGNFVTTYTLGDDNYDESFSIETPMGEFLGECGVGISETIGTGTPDKVTALEVWLFDKSDIRTVTKVLMSEYAYHDDTLRTKLAPKGELILASLGQVITLETASLQVKAEITDLAYGSGDLPPQSYFAKLTVELVATATGPTESARE